MSEKLPDIQVALSSLFEHVSLQGEKGTFTTVGLMLVHCRRRWTNIKPTAGGRLLYLMWQEARKVD